MLSKTKSYKKVSKHNKKRHPPIMNETGEYAVGNSSKRNPIVSLPEITTSPIFQVYRRFLANNAISGNLAITDLQNQFMMAVTTILAYPYIRAVRLKKIRMLVPITTQGQSVSCTLAPVGADSANNSFNSVPETYLDTSSSIDVPAYLSLTPSIATPLGSWHFADSNVSAALLSIVCPAGTTLDILFEIIPRASASGTPGYSRAIVSGTVGVLYGAPILTSLFPVGVNQI